MTSERMTVALVFIAIAFLACLAPLQSDTWWQLRSGELFWQTGHVPLTDSFSHTAFGRDWPNHEWLASAVFALAHRIGGLPLLQLVAASAIVGALAITWRLTAGRFEVRIVLFSVSLFSTFGSWSVRPQAFSMLFFATTCALLAADRWWWLPLVFVVWVNLHAVGLIGVITVAAAALARASMQRSRPWRDAAVLLACVAATTLSPLGAGVWVEALTSIRRSVSNQILEWTRPGVEPVNLPFWVLVAALPVLAWVRRRTLDARTVALAGAALGITPLAVTTVRNVSLFVLVAVPALTAVLASGRPEPRLRTVAERTGVNAMIVIAVAVFSAMTVWSIWTRTPADIGWSPIQPAAVAAVRGCPGNLYNTFDQGGVLIWFVRDRPVFIDNRQDFYPADLLTRSRHVEFTGDYGELFRDYDVRCAVVPPGSLTAAALARDPRWRRQYNDHQWELFERQ